MQRLLAFIENNFHLIIFLLLQAVCGLLLFKLNPYQQAFISNSASSVTAAVNDNSTSIKNYFKLGQENKNLQALFADSLSYYKENLSLMYLSDTLVITDTLRDPLYSIIPAQVVYNSINKADNVFVINKGTKDGISKGSGVLSSTGVAGIVLSAGPGFSTVMSVLNSNFRVVPKINGLQFFTDIIWDNKNPYTLKINKINKLEDVKEGDLVTTGNSSLIFPADIPIGTVKSIKTIDQSQYFDTEIETATNFRALHYVFVMNHNFRTEIEELIEDE